MNNIAVATLARDCESNIPKYTDFLINLKKSIQFNSFIYENDSTDNTKKLLPDIADYCISENLGLNKFEGSPATIERATLMSSIRNRLKKLIFDNGDYEIVIFTDIDLVAWPDINKIVQNIDFLQNNTKTACVTSNGQSFYNGYIIYYDIWSLVINKKIQNHKIWLPADIQQDMQVDSAFGGLAIYYGPAIKYIDYKPINLDGFPCQWHPINRPACEHCSLNLQIREQNLKIIIDKEQVLYR